MTLTPEERARHEEAIRELEAQIAEHRARLGISDPAPIERHLQQIGERVDALAAAVQPPAPRPQYRFMSPGDVPFVDNDEAVRQHALADRDARLAMAAEHAPPAHPPRFIGDHDVPYQAPYGHDMTPQEALEAAQRTGAEAIRRQDQQRRR